MRQLYSVRNEALGDDVQAGEQCQPFVKYRAHDVQVPLGCRTTSRRVSYAAHGWLEPVACPETRSVQLHGRS